MLNEELEFLDRLPYPISLIIITCTDLPVIIVNLLVADLHKENIVFRMSFDKPIKSPSQCSIKIGSLICQIVAPSLRQSAPGQTEQGKGLLDQLKAKFKPQSAYQRVRSLDILFIS